MKKTFALILTFFSFLSIQAVQRLPYVLDASGVGCDTIYTLPDAPANYVGGMDSMYTAFSKQLTHAENLTTYMSTNIILVKILVNEKGEILNAKILRSFSEEYSQDVMAVLEKFPVFTPAKQKGRAVCSYKIIKLYFK